MQRCSQKAYAMCPDRHMCGPIAEATFADDSECAAFNNAVDDKPMTNGDYIRSMTDDQLSILLNGNMICDLCIHGAGCVDPYNMSRCIAGVKEYLGRERKVDNGQEEKEEPGTGEGSAGTDEEGRA